MEKEKQLESLQLQYDLFEGPDVCSVRKTHQEVSLTKEEVDVARSCVDLDRKRNKRRRFISEKLGSHRETFKYLDPWYYDMDDRLLDEEDAILDLFYRQVDSVCGYIFDDNCCEMYRLLAFLTRKNRMFIGDVKDDRRCLKISATGEEFERRPKSEEPEVFNEWFKGQLQRSISREIVEKTKK